jgi:hypothetical protein
MNAPAKSTGRAIHGALFVCVVEVLMAAMLPRHVRVLNYLGGKCLAPAAALA